MTKEFATSVRRFGGGVLEHLVEQHVGFGVPLNERFEAGDDGMQRLATLRGLLHQICDPAPVHIRVRRQPTHAAVMVMLVFHEAS
jgi:hypothetical protein